MSGNSRQRRKEKRKLTRMGFHRWLRMSRGYKPMIDAIESGEIPHKPLTADMLYEAIFNLITPINNGRPNQAN